MKKMVEIARNAGFEIYESTLGVKYVPTEDELESCFKFGEEIAEKYIQTADSKLAYPILY